MAIRLDNQKPFWLHFDSLQGFAHTFRPGGLCIDKHRHIGAELQTDILQLTFIQTTAP